MIALLSVICVIGIFIAGNIFGLHTVAGMLMLAFFVMCMGVLIAAAETHGFEGQRLVQSPMPLTWDKLFLNVARMAVDRGTFVGKERMYVHTPTGIVPVTGVFTARMNHEMGIVLDTTPSLDDAAANLNALKQGVM